MGVFDNFINGTEINPVGEVGESRHFINEYDMKDECSSIVDSFYLEGKASVFADGGLGERLDITTSFYDDVKRSMGIDAELSFVPMSFGQQGGYNPQNNSIELNMNLLEQKDCSGLLNTILHEARHAFQLKAIENPNSVSVDVGKINEWRENFVNYIPPELDYEEYRNQSVEADAFAYADTILPDSTCQGHFA